jgi:hypothetical protein
MSPVKARTIRRSADIASLLESQYFLRRHGGTECFGFFEICSAEAFDNFPISLIIQHRAGFIEVLSATPEVNLKGRQGAIAAARPQIGNDKSPSVY